MEVPVNHKNQRVCVYVCVCLSKRERDEGEQGEIKERIMQIQLPAETPILFMARKDASSRQSSTCTRAHEPTRLPIGTGGNERENNLILARRSRTCRQYIFSPHFPDRLNPTHMRSGERERGKRCDEIAGIRGPEVSRMRVCPFIGCNQDEVITCAKGLSLLGDHKMPPERFIFHSQNPLQRFTHIQEMRG